MTEEEGLIAGIIAAPADDLPRLVYADWLGERKGTEPCTRCFEFGSRRVIKNPHPRRNSSAVVICPTCSGSGFAPDAVAVREAFIRSSVAVGELGENGWTLRPQVHHERRELFRIPGLREEQYFYRRGFVYKVRAPLRQLVGTRCKHCGGSGMWGSPPRGECWACHGDRRNDWVLRDVCRVHPVERAEATDVRANYIERDPGFSPWRVQWPTASLLDAGFDVPDGTGGWHPFEEAVYDEVSAALIREARGVDAVPA